MGRSGAVRVGTKKKRADFRQGYVTIRGKHGITKASGSPRCAQPPHQDHFSFTPFHTSVLLVRFFSPHEPRFKHGEAQSSLQRILVPWATFRPFLYHSTVYSVPDSLLSLPHRSGLAYQSPLNRFAYSQCGYPLPSKHLHLLRFRASFANPTRQINLWHAKKFNSQKLIPRFK